MTETRKEVFPVFRTGRKSLGYVLGLLTLLGLVAHVLQSEPATLKMAFSLLGLALASVILVKSARNVRQIRVETRAIRFLPVGVELQFTDIDSMRVPSWADRHDTPPNALGRIEITLKTEQCRYVPGAVLLWGNKGQLNISGSDGNAVLRALRQKLREA